MTAPRIADPRFLQAAQSLAELADRRPEVEIELRRRCQELLKTMKESQTAASPSIQQERSTIQGRMQGFEYRRCAAWQEFERRGWAQLRFPEYVSIALVLSNASNIALDRESKRRKPVLFKWLDDNWLVVQPILQRLDIEF
jgi:hypothetical protein